MLKTSSPKISIIVPVYKAERYLHRCVDSILSQSFTDFELILVDDGSPDKSALICDEYAARDSRVKVYHKTNGGVSSARQCGIENAQGEYVIHADPDDWVEPTMLWELYYKAKEECADMVICDFFLNYSDRQVYVKQQPSSLDSEIVLKELFQHLYGSCWNKLIRRDYCNNNGGKFDTEMSFCEDLYFHASLLKYDTRVSYLSRAFYHYDQCINDNSICQSYSKDLYEYDKKIYSKFCNLLKESSAYEVAELNMGFVILSRAFWGEIFSSKDFKKEFANYLPYVMKKSSGLCKWCMYLSCKGFYRPTMFIYKCFISIRRIGRKFLKAIKKE